MFCVLTIYIFSKLINDQVDESLDSFFLVRNLFIIII